MRKVHLFCLVALFLGLFMTSVDAGEKKYKLALVLKSLTNPAIKQIADGAQAAAAEYGVELTILSSQGFSALEEQINQIEDLMRRDFDVIGIQAVDSKGVIPVIEEANAKNIPIISVDTGADGGKVLTYISTDNTEAGFAAGQWLINQVGEGKVAMIEGTPGSQQGRERRDGFHAALNAQTKVKIVSSIAANFERVKGMEIMEDILTANPDLKGVFCANDEMALGALETLRQRNAIGKVIILGMNGAPDAILSTFNNEIQGTVVQFTDYMGASFVRLAVQYLDSNKTVTFPPFFNTGYGIADTKFVQKLFNSFGLTPKL